MTGEIRLEKARLAAVELTDADAGGRVLRGPVDVQFNPESMKLAYSNSVAKTDATGTAGMQFLASTSSKLDFDLWFDASVQPPGTDEGADVRALMDHLHSLIFPEPVTDQGEAKFVVPAVRFSWGTFLFVGVITSLNETLDLFSNDGRPLRSKASVSLSAQDVRRKIESLENARAAGPGQTPQQPVGEGDSVQQAAARSGRAGDWRRLADAAGIDNPRMPGAGTLLPNARGRLA